MSHYVLRHFYSISAKKTNTEISKHFNSVNHQGLQNVEIHIVDFIHAHPAGEKSRFLRNLIEFNWIQRMHSNAPTGIVHILFSLNPFLKIQCSLYMELGKPSMLVENCFLSGLDLND